MRNFSELYRVQEKYEEAEKLDKKLFEIGDFDRAVEIGNAESEKRNYAEAEKWYLAGAEKGNIVSMYSLAYFYENVNDYNYKDVDKAIEWCEKASNEGYPLAMLRLGHLYYQKGNRRKAKFWFEKALINGRLDAKKGLEKLN